MGKIDELIQQYCPDGVEFKTVKSCAQVGTGSSDRKDASDNGKYPFYVRSKNIEHKDDYEFDEEAIIIPGEGSVGDIFHYVNGKYALHQRAYRIHFTNPSVNTRFVKYYMESAFKAFIMMKAVSSTVSSIRKPMIEDFEIPVPPLPVQEEIVRILDTFTELETELEKKLEAEFELRQKQYKYYRNELLKFESRDDVEWKPIGEVGEIIRGKRFVHKDDVDEGVPAIHYGELYTYYGVSADNVKTHIRSELKPKMRYAHKGDVIIVGAGENKIDIGVGVAWLGDEDVAVHDACFILTNHNQSSRYLSYCLRTEDYHRKLFPFVSEGKICSFLKDGLAQVTIPVPQDVNEQERIADILDSLDKLVSDISVDLSTEIKMRHQQYEYYRDRLLAFENKKGE